MYLVRLLTCALEIAQIAWLFVIFIGRRQSMTFTNYWRCTTFDSRMFMPPLSSAVSGLKNEHKDYYDKTLITD